MNQDQIKELRRLAEAASPGPWRGDRFDGTVKYCVMSSNGKQVIAGDNGNSESGPFGVTTNEDENYILAAHPLRILELLDHIATLEQESAANLQRALVAEKDAERWQSILELDGGSIYHLLGDYDGIRHEVACQAIDGIATNTSTQLTDQQNVSINGGNIDISTQDVG